MKKIVASLLLAVTLAAQAEPTERYSILDWNEIAATIEQCLQWKMPRDSSELGIVTGPEDAFYISPTQSDIEEMVAFAMSHKEWTKYTEESWDCDNFAREAKHWMDVWALRHYKNSRAAVAVGMAYVRISTEDGLILGYHVMNVIRRNDGQWFFLEPQNGVVVPVDGPLANGTVVILKVTL